MAISEGNTTLPTDSASKTQNGDYDGTNFYHSRIENATSKAKKVSATDSVGSPIQQDGSVGHKLLGVSHYGQTAAAGDTAVQVATPVVVGDTVTGGAGAATTLAYAAPGANISHYLAAIYVGFGTAPAASMTVTITEDPAGTPIIKFVAPIASVAGVVAIQFPVRMKFTANKAINIVLSAGGGSVLGYVNANHWTAAG